MEICAGRVVGARARARVSGRGHGRKRPVWHGMVVAIKVG
jgi:hypothetical protein